MRHWAVTVGALVLVFLVCVEAFGWGFSGHRKITARAVALLPEEMSGFFIANEDFLVRHSVEPDLAKRNDSLEQFNHYIDIDYYGDYPFAELPRDYEMAARKFGADTIRAYGLLPWKIDEFTRLLRDAMTRNDHDSILHYAAYLAHYVEDAHVPLHATLNHDGQLTNQKGLHSRFESDIPEQYGGDYQFGFPDEILSITNTLEFAFQTVLESYTRVHQILSADSVARSLLPPEELTHVVESNGKQRIRYTKQYFDQFNQRLGDLPRRQMEAAIVAVARFWYTAWVDAGKPALRSRDRG